MKKCKECNKEKKLTLFYKNGNGKTRPKCKECERLKYNKQFKEKKCNVCEKIFKPISSVHVSCSFDCKVKNSTKKRSNKPKSKNCKLCNKEFKPYTSLDKFCSANCRVENMKSKRGPRWSDESVKKRMGKNNPSYRNGMYSSGNKKTAIGERLFIRNRKEIKQKMIDDNGYVHCQNCGTSNSLKWETHHIVFRSEKPLHTNLHDKENLIFLCISCHNKFHKNKGFRNELVLNRGLCNLFGNDILDK